MLGHCYGCRTVELPSGAAEMLSLAVGASDRLGDDVDMLMSAATCATHAHTGIPWAAVLATSVLILGGWGLYWVAAGYPRHMSPAARRLGGLLQAFGLLFSVCTMICWLSLRTDGCGHVVGSAGAWEARFFLATVVTAGSGTLLARTNAGWIATATVVVADAALALLLWPAHPHAIRNEVVGMLLAHCACTAVATWWSRQLRSSSRPLRAKAAEASRVLASAWVVIVFLLLVAGGRIDRELSESGLVGLFVVTAIGLVLGPGYTHYAEASGHPDRCQPEPDRITDLLTRLRQRSVSAKTWAVEYREHF